MESIQTRGSQAKEDWEVEQIQISKLAFCLLTKEKTEFQKWQHLKGITQQGLRYFEKVIFSIISVPDVFEHCRFLIPYPIQLPKINDNRKNIDYIQSSSHLRELKT